MANGKWKMSRAVAARLSVCLFPLTIFHVVGCSDNHAPTTRPSTVQDRQKAALDDPFSYSPYSDKNDISGGELNEWDKDGLKRDMDNVLNP